MLFSFNRIEGLIFHAYKLDNVYLHNHIHKFWPGNPYKGVSWGQTVKAKTAWKIFKSFIHLERPDSLWYRLDNTCLQNHLSRKLDRKQVKITWAWWRGRFLLLWLQGEGKRLLLLWRGSRFFDNNATRQSVLSFVILPSLCKLHEEAEDQGAYATRGRTCQSGPTLLLSWSKIPN